MSKPKKRRFEPDAAFFEQGSIICRLLQETLVPLSSLKSDGVVMDEDVQVIDCQLQGCYQQFSSLYSYEEHYATRHRNVCRECGKILPTTRLLDLHIDELHNPLFDMQSKKSPMFQCLISGCAETFMSSKIRRKHLIEVHKYPSSFRFERAALSKCKTSQKNKKDDKSSEKMDITSQNNSSQGSRYKYNCKVPASFSFGQGVQKGFVRRKRPKGNHLIKMGAVQSQNVTIEDVDMKDLATALEQ
ncbi:zinc finger protein 511-like [Watersipora subatra]|uniref:zinc finger protein 511-like n=1 Tax=Watersipora subatra TaxID=2589382 RepID=UPI00355C7B65